MWITDVMKEHGMTALDLRRKSGIPRSTLRDILNGTSDLRGCKASTIHKLAGALELPMADVMKLHRPMEASVKAEHSDSRIHTVMGYGNYIVDRRIFLRKLRKLGAHRFVNNVLGGHYVENYYKTGEYEIALFLVGLCDYLCEKDGEEPLVVYNMYRGDFLDRPVFPKYSPLSPRFTEAESRSLMMYSIPQLMRFNIVETEMTLNWM